MLAEMSVIIIIPTTFPTGFNNYPFGHSTTISLTSTYLPSSPAAALLTPYTIQVQSPGNQVNCLNTFHATVPLSAYLLKCRL